MIDYQTDFYGWTQEQAERHYNHCIEHMLCKELHPVCSRCPIDMRLDCKHYQDLHYENIINDRHLKMIEFDWCRK